MSSADDLWNDDREPDADWQPAQLFAQALANLAVVHELLMTADADRVAATQRARERAVDLAIEVGRAVLAGALVPEHEGYMIRELAAALWSELLDRKERRLAALRGGERITLKVALHRWGGHRQGCPRRDDRAIGVHCSCGWSEVAPEIGAEP